MKKWMALLLCICMACSLSSCGERENERISGSRILIAYFTWADNTQVDNPEEVDVDATTSASVLPLGSATKIAGRIRERTGGDLFSIIVEEPYSSDYGECLDRAADEKAENARPVLVSHKAHAAEYHIDAETGSSGLSSI